MTKQQISCTKCGEKLDVENLLYQQLQEQVSKEYRGKLATLEKQQQKLDEAVAEGVKKQMTKEKSDLEKKLRAEIGSEKDQAIALLEEELSGKSKQLSDYNKLKSQLSKTLREKDELKETIRAEAEERLTQLVAEEKNKIRAELTQSLELTIAEKDITISKLLEQTKDMQKRLERGAISQQLQGEAQEISIENYLRANFPLDGVSEIRKGVHGADTLVTVNTQTRTNCGLIYYESKRAQNFSETWIGKFKDDMREKGALIGVLVTEVMPSDMQRLGLRDGVWVCTYDEFKGLCFAMRETVIMYSNALATQQNKGDKMVMLYDYLTGNEFKQHVEAIVEGFSQMELDLISERRSMESIWKKREKQIQKVLHSTVHMYSAIRGIGGSAIASIKALELPSGENSAA